LTKPLQEAIRRRCCGTDCVRVAAAVAVLLLIPAAGAPAYVLQGPHVLELMIQHLGKAQRLLVEQQQVIHGAGENTEPVALTETVRYRFPGGFRSDMRSGDLERIHLVAQGRRLTVMDGQVTAGDDRFVDLYKDLMLFRSRPMLVHRLASLGVETGVSSYGLFEDQVAFVVGARYPDETLPQVWVEKDTFRPLRWIVRPAPEAGQPPQLEIRYRRWARHGNRWYPQQIELIRDGHLARTIQVSRIEVNPTFAAKTFDTGHLRSTYRSTPAAGLQEGEPDRLREVRETIEDFKRLYE
jgi:outer membrane lipoprotein-sorting protein